MANYVPIYNSEENLIALSRYGNYGFIASQRHLLGFWKTRHVKENIQDKREMRKPCSMGKIPVVELRVFS